VVSGVQVAICHPAWGLIQTVLHHGSPIGCADASGTNWDWVILRTLIACIKSRMRAAGVQASESTSNTSAD
jgi:hypothetical protein